ncbi:MAG: hypothetical protein H6983_23855 [Ectothiorhodospiraceae bacterium]|nr:hypothetical protein [Ectothiorhodospiraceae bacterium]
MGRDVRILERFPCYVRADAKGKTLGVVAGALGARLDIAQRAAGDVLAAHRLRAARAEIDLLRLAASVGLSSADLGLLRAYYDAGVFGPRDADGHAEYLDQLRATIARTVDVQLDGCGTIWALLEGTSILIGATTLTGDDGRPHLEHPDEGLLVDGVDRGGFIHRLAVRYRHIESDSPTESTGYVYLVENPLEARSTGETEMVQRQRLRIDKGGFFDGVASVRITGVAGRTVMPQIINVTTRQGIGFDGAVTAGETLVFTRDGQALYQGLDVTDRCHAFEGALLDEDTVTASGSTHPFVVVEPPGAMHRAFPRPVVVPLESLTMPKVPLGRSDWRFAVREGAFDADRFGRCVFAPPPGGSYASPSAIVEIEWEEHVPFAATVLLPAEIASIEPLLGTDVDLRAWLRAGLERFRAAGIRLAVEYYTDSWILDHSVLRDTDALTGSGVLFDPTTP